MSFTNYYFLFLFPFIIILFFIGIKGIFDYEERKNKFASIHLFDKLRLKDKSLQQKVSLIIWLVIFSLTIISLARPLGQQVNKEIEETGRDIVIAFDISDSMRANDLNLSASYAESVQVADITGITRFDGAKKIIKKIVENLNSDRVALVAFSDYAFSLAPLTNDYEIFSSFLDNLDFSFSNNGSTNIGEAIEVSAKRFNKNNKDEAKIILLISDGEDQNRDLIEKAKQAKEKGIIIYTIGIGSNEGSKIPLGKDIYGNEVFKTYLGDNVITKLNDKALKEISALTGGKYFQVDDNLTNYVINEINRIKSSNYKSTKKPQYQELFQFFILLIFILLIIESLLPLIFKR